MNRIAKTLLCSLSGTSLMTLSSAVFSMGKQDFREPRHLGRLIGRLLPLGSDEMKVLAGWAAHYGMGTVFSAVYVMLWEDKKIGYSWKEALGLGILSGGIGALIWKATFKAHPLTPVMNYPRFYLQRLPAHIVFAAFATLAYYIIRQEEKRKRVGLNGPVAKVQSPGPIGSAQTGLVK